MPHISDPPVEVEVVRLSSGNTAIRLPDGDLCDPIFASVASLCRVPEDHYRVVLAWVELERERLQRRGEQAEQAGRAAAEALRPTLEVQAAARAKWVSQNFMDAA